MISDCRGEARAFEAAVAYRDMRANRIVGADGRCTVSTYKCAVELNIFGLFRAAHRIFKDAVINRYVFTAVTFVKMPRVTVSEFAIPYTKIGKVAVIEKRSLIVDLCVSSKVAPIISTLLVAV